MKTVPIVQLLVDADLVFSRSEARRKVSMGGVKIDGAVVNSIAHEVELTEAVTVQVGRREAKKLVNGAWVRTT